MRQEASEDFSLIGEEKLVSIWAIYDCCFLSENLHLEDLSRVLFHPIVHKIFWLAKQKFDAFADNRPSKAARRQFDTGIGAMLVRKNGDENREESKNNREI